MERDLRFVRDLLEWVENLPRTQPDAKSFRNTSINPISDLISQYDDHTVEYNLDLLRDGGFITFHCEWDRHQALIDLHETIDLTWKGHNLLDMMRVIESDPEKENDLIYFFN